jgi:hypothetical protein
MTRLTLLSKSYMVVCLAEQSDMFEGGLERGMSGNLAKL